MLDPAAIERIQSYRVCGQTVYNAMPAAELNTPFETAFLSVGEPPITNDGAVTIYSGRNHSHDRLSYLTLTLNDLQTIIQELPDITSVYADGKILSITEDNNHATKFTGSTPLTFSPYPDSTTTPVGLHVAFGQPCETGSQYIFTPSQTTHFQELLSAINICQQTNTRYVSTVKTPKTICSDGTIDHRKSLNELFD